MAKCCDEYKTLGFNYCPMCGEWLSPKGLEIFRVSRFREGRLVSVKCFSGALADLLYELQFVSSEVSIEVLTTERLVEPLPPGNPLREDAFEISLCITSMSTKQILEYITAKLPGYDVRYLGDTRYMLRRSQHA